MGASSVAAPGGRARRLAASACLAATSATFCYHGLRGILRYGSWDAFSLVGAALLAAAAIGIGKDAIVAQVLARGTAWLLLGATTFAVVVTAMQGRALELEAGWLLAMSGAALVFGRGMLETATSRASFAPVAYRRWLLASAQASAAAGVAATIAAAVLQSGISERSGSGPRVALGALALALLASAVGVARMRAWGIFLGGVTSAAVLGAAALRHDAAGLVLSLTAIPGALLLAPVARARFASPQGRHEPKRVATNEATYAKVRVDVTPADITRADVTDVTERGEEWLVSERPHSRGLVSGT